MTFHPNRWVNRAGWLGLLGLAVITVFVTQYLIAEPETSQAAPTLRTVDDGPQGWLGEARTLPPRPEPVHPDLNPMPPRGQKPRPGQFKDFDVWFQSVGFDPQTMTVGFRVNFAGWSVNDRIYKFVVIVQDITHGWNEPEAFTVYENRQASPIRPMPAYQVVQDSLLHQFPVQAGRKYHIVIRLQYSDPVEGRLAEARAYMENLANPPLMFETERHFVTIPPGT